MGGCPSCVKCIMARGWMQPLWTQLAHRDAHLAHWNAFWDALWHAHWAGASHWHIGLDVQQRCQHHMHQSRCLCCTQCSVLWSPLFLWVSTKVLSQTCSMSPCLASYSVCVKAMHSHISCICMTHAQWCLACLPSCIACHVSNVSPVCTPIQQQPWVPIQACLALFVCIDSCLPACLPGRWRFCQPNIQVSPSQAKVAVRSSASRIRY